MRSDEFADLVNRVDASTRRQRPPQTVILKETNPQYAAFDAKLRSLAGGARQEG